MWWFLLFEYCNFNERVEFAWWLNIRYVFGIIMVCVTDFMKLWDNKFSLLIIVKTIVKTTLNLLFSLTFWCIFKNKCDTCDVWSIWLIWQVNTHIVNTHSLSGTVRLKRHSFPFGVAYWRYFIFQPISIWLLLSKRECEV